MAGKSSCVACERRESICVVRSSVRARWARVERGCLDLWMADFGLVVVVVVEDLEEGGGRRGLEECLAMLELDEGSGVLMLD